ncbi:terminase small subunit [Ralstonia phage Anchaing]|uniref:DNA maturase A n=1 Tax=Ralstonia phage Anchaing TaxID=2759719 RepID=A0A7G5B8B3_9CAUD|nr:terminase small subunit [Ralstonia phage Anchaing]QMV32536.1 hypothetical protein A1_00016 [Ralstonia phage Anchaing]
MSKASTTELESLHAAVAKELQRRIEKNEASAADIGAAIKFLKDNSITAVIEDNSTMAALQEKLRARREKRSAKSTVSTGAITEADLGDIESFNHVH